MILKIILTFAANTPDMFTCCAKIVEFKCEGVDLNLGCPQNIARKGHYGCFLHDEWQLIHDMSTLLTIINIIVRQASSNLSIPVSAKIRIFDSIQKSVDYARMLENSGCSMLAVHGRTRNQKGQNTGLADWEIIKIIKQTLSIPVISNGNILYHSDIQRCIDYTGADGVMVAEGCLYNPYIFEDITVSTCAAAFEYIKYAQKYDAKPHAWRCHLFKILYHVFNIIPEMRKELADVKDLMSAKLLINKISSILDKRFSENLGLDWTCKPYIR
ncbi:hypothetical protein HZS_6643, partial [Henneguya salminicola]